MSVLPGEPIAAMVQSVPSTINVTLLLFSAGRDNHGQYDKGMSFNMVSLYLFV